MITVKRLENHQLIEDACALLYNEYIEAGGWKFSEDNPSQLRVEIKNKKSLLLDRISDHAVWFGAFHDNQLVGCIRLFKATNNIPFEIEKYETAKEIIERYIQDYKPNLYECSRACVSSEYRGMEILNKLYLISLEYCQKEQASVFGSATNPYVKSLLRRIEWPLKQEQAFKFEESDSASVNFYLADYKNGEVDNIIERLKFLGRSRKADQHISILDALSMVAPIFPAPVYWHDVNGVVLGLNEHCLKGMGVSSSDAVIGKTPYDFYPKKTAEHILKHNEIIMRSGEVLSQEESIHDITTGEYKTYLAIKAPLYDEHGNVVGIIGSSIDITAEKDAERLRVENERQKAEIQAQDTFKKCLDDIQHTIQNYKIEVLHEKLGIEQQTQESKEIVPLTKRQREILYYLSLNKSPKEIAQILSIIDKKSVTSTTIQSVIDKQLYPKFNVYSISHLIEQANVRKLIPFLLDN